MERLKRGVPSPALVVAVVALVAGLGGTAVAGVAVTALNKGERVQVKRIANKQAKQIGRRQARVVRRQARRIANRLDRRALGDIDEGPPGPEGATGPQGPAGEPGADALAAIIGAAGPNDTLRFSELTGGSNLVTDARRDLSPNRVVSLGEFAAEVIAAPQAGNFLTLTVLVDGADTALSCTIPAAATSCESGETVTVPPRSGLSIKLEQDAVESENLSVGWSMTVE